MSKTAEEILDLFRRSGRDLEPVYEEVKRILIRRGHLEEPPKSSSGHPHYMVNVRTKFRDFILEAGDIFSYNGLYVECQGRIAHVTSQVIYSLVNSRFVEAVPAQPAPLKDRRSYGEIGRPDPED